MKKGVDLVPVPNNLNVLLIGNNPIDMGRTLEKINQIKGKKIITEIAFDLQSVLERLMRFTPNFIIIDDNIGRAGIAEAVATLSSKRQTKNTPITILKNSNYRESSATYGVLDYILKQNFSAESLYTAIKNSLKFRKTQAYLSKAYRKRTGQLKRLVTFADQI
jgi:CheY-like chemotaxis protein